jgi:iron-sulfur cluster assembly protein
MRTPPLEIRSTRTDEVETMSITLTESAAEHVKHMMAEKSGIEGLRLGITKSGCSGFAYVMDFADAVGEEDRVFESHGVKVIVDNKAVEALDGTELDYVREGLNRIFKFNNPNVKNECGCGESFSV